MVLSAVRSSKPTSHTARTGARHGFRGSRRRTEIILPSGKSGPSRRCIRLLRESRLRPTPVLAGNPRSFRSSGTGRYGAESPSRRRPSDKRVTSTVWLVRLRSCSPAMTQIGHPCRSVAFQQASRRPFPARLLIRQPRHAKMSDNPAQIPGLISMVVAVLPPRHHS